MERSGGVIYSLLLGRTDLCKSSMIQEILDGETMVPISRGTDLELTVERLAFGGKAIARVEGLVVFLDHALPGQRVKARIVKRRRQHAEARVLEVVSPSSGQREPLCMHFGFCGGCQWQDLSYEDQLVWKREHVLESIRHLGGIKDALVEETVPSPCATYYRNKMEFTFSDRRWLLPEEIDRRETCYNRDFALGLHISGFFDKVFNVEQCLLESPGSVAVLGEVRRWCEESGIPPYSIRTQKGFWRFLVIREGKRTGQTLLHLITTAQEHHAERVNELAGHLKARFPDITTFVHSVSSQKAQVATGQTSRILFGPGFIEEMLGPSRFRISAHSFFQTNPYGAEKIYESIVKLAEFSGCETVWDLYCGTGSIAIVIAPRVHRVVGFEVVPEAIEDAYANCRLNGVENCTFHAGDLRDSIAGAQNRARSGGLPDVIITDPPRAGMHPKVVKAILEIAPPCIVAVSCNPATLARDLALLSERYTVEKVMPFDLFPQTPHIECLVKLRRTQ